MPRFRTDPDAEDFSLLGSFSRIAPSNSDAAPQPHEQKIPRKYQLLWASFRTLFPKEYADTTVARKAFLDLTTRYSESHRKHHTLTHIEDLLSQYHYNKHLWGKDAQAVLAALFYHDVIYNCHHGKDEEESALYAEHDLKALGVPQSVIERTKSIILATIKHNAMKDDPATQLFLDMDMSILAFRPDIYFQYVSNTRHEYCAKLKIQPSDFNLARAERFLIPILSANTPIFKSAEYKHLNAIAQFNLLRELDSYESKAQPLAAPSP